MQALVVEFHIRPEFVRDFAAAIEDNARLSRRPSRVAASSTLPHPADPTLFFLYELYDDEAAIQAHLKSAHFLQMDQTTAGWVRSKVVRKLQRTTP